MIGTRAFLQMQPHVRQEVEFLDTNPHILRDLIQDMRSVKKLKVDGNGDETLQFDWLFTGHTGPTTRMQTLVSSLANIPPNDTNHLVDTLESLTIHSSISEEGGAEQTRKVMEVQAAEEEAQKGTRRARLKEKHKAERDHLLASGTLYHQLAEERLATLYKEEVKATDEFLLQNLTDKASRESGLLAAVFASDNQEDQALVERMRRQVQQEVVRLRQRHQHEVHALESDQKREPGVPVPHALESDQKREPGVPVRQRQVGTEIGAGRGPEQNGSDDQTPEVRSRTRPHELDLNKRIQIRILQEKQETEILALPPTLQAYDKLRQEWWAQKLRQLPPLPPNLSEQERPAFAEHFVGHLRKLWNMSQRHQWEHEELRRAERAAAQHKDFLDRTRGVRPAMDLRPFTKLRELEVEDFDGPILGLPSSLKTLKLPSDYKGPLSPHLAMGLPNLEELHFGVRCDGPFPSEFFRPLTKLRVLHMYGWVNHELPDLPLSLRELVLATRIEQSLDMCFFRRHTALEKLTFWEGSGPVPAGAFEGYSSLKKLVVSGKCNLQFRQGSTDGLANLTHLEIGGFYDQLLPDGFFEPLAKLETLYISEYYNKPIDHLALPLSLQELVVDTFAEVTLPDLAQLTGLKTLRLVAIGFNQPVRSLPPQLQILHFAHRFNQPLPQQLPDTLCELVFGDSFNNGNTDMFELPASIEKLVFGRLFNQPLPLGFFAKASRLRELDFGLTFDRPLSQRTRLPSSLRSLKLSCSFNFTNLGTDFLKYTQIQELSLPATFENCTLGPGGLDLPQTLKKLTLVAYDQQLPPDFSARYPNIHKLVFRRNYNQPLLAGQFSNVRELQLGRDFAHPLVQGAFSPLITHLTFERTVEVPNNISAENLTSFLPESLETLEITDEFLTAMNERVGHGWYSQLGLAIRGKRRYSNHVVLIKNTKKRKGPG